MPVSNWCCGTTLLGVAPGDLQSWEQEHRALLERIAPPQFTVTHYAALTELTKK